VFHVLRVRVQRRAPLPSLAHKRQCGSQLSHGQERQNVDRDLSRQHGDKVHCALPPQHFLAASGHVVVVAIVIVAIAYSIILIIWSDKIMVVFRPLAACNCRTAAVVKFAQVARLAIVVAHVNTQTAKHLGLVVSHHHCLEEKISNRRDKTQEGIPRTQRRSAHGVSEWK
jgi:hypothetical protein